MAIYANATSTFDTSAHTLYLKLSFICTVLYFGVITAIKISILLMYRRLFSINKSFHLQSLLVGMVVVAFGVATTIATIFNCHPLKYNWIGLVPVEHCFNYNVFWMVTGAVEVVIDTVILALPVRMVLGLQVSLRQKASIALVFLLGSLYVLPFPDLCSPFNPLLSIESAADIPPSVIITGIIRVVYGYIPRSREPENTKAGLWSTIHLLMGIICACLPTLCPLFPRTTSIVLNTSSAIRRRYYSWTGQYRKDLSRSDSGIGSSTGDAIKISPFKPLECSCGANFKGVRAEIESVAIGIHDCYCGDAIMKDTRVEIETLPMRRPGECYCGAILRDPHAEMVRMNGQRGW